MSYSEQVSGLDFCTKAKQSLKKKDESFLGAHGGVGWEATRYCKFCNEWHLVRHIMIALDYKTNNELKAEREDAIAKSFRNICVMFEKKGAILTDESRKWIMKTIIELYRQNDTLDANLSSIEKR